MKRVLILLIVGAVALTIAHRLVAATGVAPATAFPPFPPGMSLNTDYWSGYQAGMVQAILVPDLTMPDWYTYYAMVEKSQPPRNRLGPFFPISYNDGWDDAEEVAANYFWTTSSMSCHNVDCSALPQVRKRVKPPMKQKHLDLIEKGAKGVTKTVYRGARVIL